MSLQTRIGLCLVLATSSALAVENVHTVAEGLLYRGARAESYEDFKRMIYEHDIGRIVNVENDQRSVDRERGWLDRLWREDHRRVDHDWKPIEHRGFQNEHYVNDVLNSTEDTKNGAVWLHCKRGRDRTGYLAALYRVTVQNWNKADARHEWHDAKFNGGRTNNLRFRELENHFTYASRNHK